MVLETQLAMFLLIMLLPALGRMDGTPHFQDAAPGEEILDLMFQRMMYCLLVVWGMETPQLD